MSSSTLISTFLILLLCYHQANGQPWNKNQGCAEYNSKNMTCIKCFEGYSLEETTAKCTYSTNNCVLTQQQPCKVNYCLLEQRNHCIKCVETHTLFDGRCIYDCNEKIQVTDHNSCNFCQNSDKSYVPNCSTCNISEFLCNGCQNGYFLYENQCIQSCPSGYFSNIYSECIKCNPLCSECTSYDHCTACKISSAQTPNCFCKHGVYFKNKCVSDCPSSYSGKNCEQSCGYNKYLTQYQNLSTCSEVRVASDSFCEQNLSNIHKFVSSKIVEYLEPLKLLMIQITFEDTPSVCYDYQLLDLQGNSFQLYFQPPNVAQSSSFFQRESHVYFTVPYYSFFNTSLISNEFNHFLLPLKIFWINFESKFLKIPLRKEEFYQFFENIAHHQEESSIPQNLIIPSKLMSHNCSESKICDDDTAIKSSSDNLIQITQIIDDHSYSNQVLLPFSIKLKDDNFVSYLKSFSFDNSQNGQITYTFHVDNFSSGQLTVTSILSNENLEFQWDNQQANIQYIQKNIKFQSFSGKDQVEPNEDQGKDDQDENNKDKDNSKDDNKDDHKDDHKNKDNNDDNRNKNEDNNNKDKNDKNNHDKEDKDKNNHENQENLEKAKEEEKSDLTFFDGLISGSLIIITIFFIGFAIFKFYCKNKLKIQPRMHQKVQSPSSDNSDMMKISYKQQIDA